MAKPVIKFKTYKQSARVGGKIYGVPNLADPVVANVTMAEVIDYAKLHNYSADTLEALLSQVIAGVADLVARDGRPRNLSDLLKFEPVIKGTFSNLEQTVTDQKILVRPRLLKEIRVKLDAGDYSWQNQNDATGPKLQSAAFESDGWDIESAEDWAEAAGTGLEVGISLAGLRLSPSGGWDAQSFDFDVLLRRGNDVFHLSYVEKGEIDIECYGFLQHPLNDAQHANENTLRLSPLGTAYRDVEHNYHNAWQEVGGEIVPRDVDFHAGDIIEFVFSRPLSSDGSVVSTSKRYTIRG